MKSCWDLTKENLTLFKPSFFQTWTAQKCMLRQEGRTSQSFIMHVSSLPLVFPQGRSGRSLPAVWQRGPRSASAGSGVQPERPQSGSAGRTGRTGGQTGKGLLGEEHTLLISRTALWRALFASVCRQLSVWKPLNFLCNVLFLCKCTFLFPLPVNLPEFWSWYSLPEWVSLHLSVFCLYVAWPPTHSVIRRLRKCSCSWRTTEIPPCPSAGCRSNSRSSGPSEKRSMWVEPVWQKSFNCS